MSITYLGVCDGNHARELGEDLDAGNATHAVMIYRTKDGDLRYRLVGADDLTYLVGMLGRVATHMHCIDTFDIPGT